jgi:glycosyltransferase involved in cell wall biosynthesis
MKKEIKSTLQDVEEYPGSSPITHFGISRDGKIEEAYRFEGKTSVEEDETKITVVIPTLNEEKNIVEVIRALWLAGYTDILVIDGNSQDSTVDIAEKLGVNVVHQRGRGKGNALRQVFKYDDLGDWVVMIDADGSMNPDEIGNMLKPLFDGADVVKGSRFMPLGFSDDMTFLRRMGNSFFVLLVNFIWRAGYTDLCYGYAAFTKNALKVLHPHLKSTGFEIETEIFVKAKKLGLNVKEVASVERQRKFGDSNLKSFTDGFRILKTILLEAIY